MYCLFILNDKTEFFIALLIKNVCTFAYNKLPFFMDFKLMLNSPIRTNTIKQLFQHVGPSSRSTHRKTSHIPTSCFEYWDSNVNVEQRNSICQVRLESRVGSAFRGKAAGKTCPVGGPIRYQYLSSPPNHSYRHRGRCSKLI